MPRQADETRLSELKKQIEQHPGTRAGTLARLLGWSRQRVSRSLIILNDQGVLLYEDEHGRLFPMEKGEDGWENSH